MGLLELHEQMLKEAEVKQAETKLAEERVALIEKYASAAQNLMNQYYPNNYTEADVAELATRMIDHDLKVEEEQQKVAELEEAGRIMARGFLAEANKK